MDYSLREYVEVLFLVPTMKIYLQGTPVWIFKLRVYHGLHYVQLSSLLITIMQSIRNPLNTVDSIWLVKVCVVYFNTFSRLCAVDISS